MMPGSARRYRRVDYFEPEPLIGAGDTLRRYAGCAASACSADGRSIAFLALVDDEFTVIETDVDGAAPRLIAPLPGARIAHLYWSARGDLFLAADRRRARRRKA